MLFMGRIARRSERTARFLWSPVFAYTPYTRKAAGVRMGKGKGKRQTWMAVRAAGSLLFEFRHIRVGRMYFFTQQLQIRLTTPIYTHSTLDRLVLQTTAYNCRIVPFWA